MSDKFEILLVQIWDPKLDIRNSQRVVHTEPNQLLYWNTGTSLDASKINDDCPQGGYRGSLRPASGALSETNSVTLSVKFAFEEANGIPDAPWQNWSLSAKALVDGTEATVVEGIARPPTETIQQMLGVEFKPPFAVANFPWGFAGDVHWTLSVDGREFRDTTRLEIYSLTDTLPAYYHGVVDVQFLRAMVLPARAAPNQSWSEYVIDAAFSKFGFKYDIAHGAMKYAGGALWGSYDLRRWVRGINKNNLVNCYDQAGIVLIAIALGPKVVAEWMYLDPFGFIFPTMLVGHGKCNSPFGIKENNLLVDNNLDGRTYFSNHAFARINGMIADACAGPHKCTETLDQYIGNSIQLKARKDFVDSTEQTTNAYWHSDVKAGYQDPGTAAKAGLHAGVTALNGCDIRSAKDLAAMKTTDNSIAAMEIARRGVTNADTTTYAVAIEKLHQVIQACSSCDKASGLDLDASLNAEGVEATWDISFPDQRDTEISIYICGDNNFATKMFEHDLHNSSTPWASSLEKPTHESLCGDVNLCDDDCICGQLLLASKAGEEQGLLRWVRGNLVISITGAAPASDLYLMYGTGLDVTIKNCGAAPASKLSDPTVSGSTSLVTDHSAKFEVQITVSCVPMSRRDVPSLLRLYLLTWNPDSVISILITFLTRISTLTNTSLTAL